MTGLGSKVFSNGGQPRISVTHFVSRSEGVARYDVQRHWWESHLFPLDLCRFMIKLSALSSPAFKTKMTLNQLIKMLLCCDRSPIFPLGRLER